MASERSRLRGRASTKPSNAATMRASSVSRPSSRAGQTSNNVPAYMNPAVAAKRAASPTGSIKSSRSARMNGSPTGQKRKNREEERTLDETNVQVVVRCRGRSGREIRESSEVILNCPGGPVGKEVELAIGPLPLSNKTYTFDKVFGPEADQSMIYDEVVQPILGEMLSGFNCTIFAYGQTGTGKTYTMSGDMEDSFGSYSDTAGIIPRCLYKLFHKLDAENTEYSVKCSFIELYNEELRDLLSNDDSVNIKLFEDSTKKGIVIQGMEEGYIKSAAEGVKLLQDGSHKRQVAATKCNDLSSRSHTVFTITVYVKEPSPDGEDYLRSGKLNLVDLAGSENIGRSGAQEKRAREAGMINQSLLTLGRVINNLVDKAQHVPYRESKLTRLLQDSLGGRTKTCIIATVSPAKINLEETMSTLNYAAKAKNIQNKPQVNHLLSKKALIREYVLEIERLKADLSATRQKHGVYLTNEHYEELTTENQSNKILKEENERKISALESQIRNTREKLEMTIKSFTDQKRDFDVQTKVLEETKETLSIREQELSTTKQELEEETVLREAHQVTEARLDWIGNELLSTVDTTVSDVSDLHSKIKRKEDLDLENSESWAKMQLQVANVTQMVEDQVSHFSSEQSRVADLLASKMERFARAESEKLSLFHANLESRFAKFETLKQSHGTECRKATNEMNLVLEEIKTLRDDVKVKVGEGMQSLSQAAERIAGDVVRELELFNNELRTSYTTLGREIKTAFDENNRHLSQQIKKANTLKEQMEKAVRDAVAAKESSVQSLDTLLKEERERSNLDRQNLMMQMTSLVNASYLDQEKRLATRINAVQSEINVSKDTLGFVSEGITSNLNDWAETEDGHRIQIGQTRDSIKKQLQSDYMLAEQHNSKIQSTANAIHAQTVDLVDAQMADVSTKLQSLDEFVTRARQSNERYHDAQANSLDSLVEHVRMSSDDAKKEIETVKEDVLSIKTDMISEVEQNKATLQPTSSNQTTNLIGLRNHVKEAMFRKYVPTSLTPRKREYEYPRTIPRTQPHEDILLAYRQQPRPTSAEKESSSLGKAIAIYPGSPELSQESDDGTVITPIEETPKPSVMAEIKAPADNIIIEGPPAKKQILESKLGRATRAGTASYTPSGRENSMVPQYGTRTTRRMAERSS